MLVEPFTQARQNRSDERTVNHNSASSHNSASCNNSSSEDRSGEQERTRYAEPLSSTVYHREQDDQGFGLRNGEQKRPRWETNQ